MDLVDIAKVAVNLAGFAVMPIDPQFPNQGIEELVISGFVYDRVRYLGHTDDGIIRWARDLEGDCALIMPTGYVLQYNYDEADGVEWVETKGCLTYGGLDVLLGFNPRGDQVITPDPYAQIA